MKKITLLLFFWGNICFAQNTPDTSGFNLIDKNHQLEPKIMIDPIDPLPEFPGGDLALNKYLKINLKYPQQAINDTIEGKVFVQFTVEIDSTINDVILRRGIGAGCDKEAIRLVKNMPKWIPGRDHKGKLNAVKVTLPIIFRLFEPEKEKR